MEKINIIYNYPVHYRLGIFKALNDAYEIKWFFGKSGYSIKSFSRKEAGFSFQQGRNFFIGRFYYQLGTLFFLIRSKGPIIVLNNYFCISLWLTIIYSKLFNRKLILWTHGILNIEKASSIKVHFYKLFDHIFLYSKWSKQNMKFLGISDKDMTVIGNSLKQKKSYLIDTSLKINTFNYDLLFIGRLNENKCLDMLFKSVECIKRNNSRILRVLIIGDGPHKTYLKNLCSQLKISSQIEWAGSIYDDEEKSKLIKNCRICVSPGNVGLTAIEVLGFGVPVITHNNKNHQMPEFESILNNKTGWLYEYLNNKSLTNTIIKGLDYPNMSIIHENCITEVIENWSVENQLNKINKIICQK